MKYFLKCVVIFLLFVKCGDQKSEPISVAENFSTDLMKSDIQYFKFSGKNDTVLICKYGTKINLSKESFATLDEVHLKVVEFYSISSMLLGNLYTISDKLLLESDGMIFLEFSDSNGKILSYSEDTKCEIQMPTKKKIDGMRLFYGDSVNNIVNWKAAELEGATPEPSEPRPDSAKIPNNELYNYFQIQKYGWVNCDKFRSIENKVDLLVDIEGSYKGTVFSLVLSRFNSIIPMTISNKNQLIFKEIPANEKAFLVGIGMNTKKELFYQILELNTSEKGKKFPLLKSITQKEMKVIFDKTFGEDLWSRPML